MPESPSHPLPSRARHGLTWPRARQLGRLGVGVGAATGGTWLLVSNLSHVTAVGLTAPALVPLAANAALVFGGVMFLREYWRGRRGR